ncbi:hypothetical protein K9M79_08320 [Candidatus Woesearchaeota archaeon]|nr:hypothetical protein [Candidatus Woesearchaeota archaeon]
MIERIIKFIEKEPQFEAVQIIKESGITDANGVPYRTETPLFFSLKDNEFWENEKYKIAAAKKYWFPSPDPCLYLDEKDILPENMYNSVIENRVCPEGGFSFDDETLYVEDSLTAVVVKRLQAGSKPARTYVVSTYMFKDDENKVVSADGGIGGDISSFAVGIINLYHVPYNTLDYTTQVLSVKNGIWMDIGGYWMNQYAQEWMIDQPMSREIQYEMRALNINLQTAMEQVALIKEGFAGKELRE